MQDSLHRKSKVGLWPVERNKSPGSDIRLSNIPYWVDVLLIRTVTYAFVALSLYTLSMDFCQDLICSMYSAAMSIVV